MSYFIPFQPCLAYSFNEKMKEIKIIDKFLVFLEESGAGKIIQSEVSEYKEGRRPYNPYKLFAAIIYGFSKHSGSLRKSEESIIYDIRAKSNLLSIKGIKLRVNRSAQAEGVFGVIKQDMEYDRIRRRGLEKVSAEIMLVCFGYVLRKLFKLFDGTTKMDYRIDPSILTPEQMPTMNLEKILKQKKKTKSVNEIAKQSRKTKQFLNNVVVKGAVKNLRFLTAPFFVNIANRYSTTKPCATMPLQKIIVIKNNSCGTVGYLHILF